MAISQRKTIVELNPSERDTLLARAADSNLDAADLKRIREVFESYAYVSALLERKDLSLARLKRLLFGASTETSANVLGTGPAEVAEIANVAGEGAASPAAEVANNSRPANSTAVKKRRGHGRNGAKDLPGAERVSVRLAGVQPGAACPACGSGRLYEQTAPGVMIRFVGQAPVRATIYELQKLRCQLCGKVFTAEPPVEAGSRKYDPTVGSLIGLLKYGHGFPLNRLAKMQGDLDVPLAISTQWHLIALATDDYQPVYDELLREAAQGELLMNDDTTARILAWMGKRRSKTAADAASARTINTPASSPGHETLEPDALETTMLSDERTGLYTTGIVAERGARRIAMFFTGRRHAGENMRDLLRRRAAELPPPIQMCDALSRNYPAGFQTVVGNCLAHARRMFVDVKDRFFAECERVLKALADVYAVDGRAKEEGLSAEKRMRLHQELSGPVMESLHQWLKEQIEQRRVEPNSALGAAFEYLRRHWTKLTLFLRVPGAPLDNNMVERALKKAILHRKNALFYKTEHGAAVGDVHMTLIHTCELCDTNPADYLTALQRNAQAVAAAPAEWLPWNFRDAITGHSSSS
jgi:hypothetical protein